MVQAVDGVLPGEADRAAHLDHRLRHGVQHPAGDGLDRLGLGGIGLATRPGVDGDVEQATQLVQLGGRPRQQMLDCLELGQRLPELPPGLHVGDGVFDETLADTEDFSRRAEPGTSQDVRAQRSHLGLGHERVAGDCFDVEQREVLVRVGSTAGHGLGSADDEQAGAGPIRHHRRIAGQARDGDVFTAAEGQSP